MAFKFFIPAAQASELREFDACLTMPGNWSKYILNAFECPYTNGYTKGTITKKILSTVVGVEDFPPEGYALFSAG